jgi:hypothetical protein
MVPNSFLGNVIRHSVSLSYQRYHDFTVREMK